MGMGFDPTWLRQVSPPASHDHFNHWVPAYSGCLKWPLKTLYVVVVVRPTPYLRFQLPSFYSYISCCTVFLQ